MRPASLISGAIALAIAAFVLTVLMRPAPAAAQGSVAPVGTYQLQPLGDGSQGWVVLDTRTGVVWHWMPIREGYRVHVGGADRMTVRVVYPR